MIPHTTVVGVTDQAYFLLSQSVMKICPVCMRVYCMSECVEIVSADFISSYERAACS